MTVKQPKGKILVVENETHISDVVRYVLEKQQYEVITVSTAEEAVPHLGEADLVLTDGRQPGSKGGYWLSEYVQGHHPGLNVLLMTGYHAPLDDHLAEGAAAIIRKPFDIGDLAAKVEQYAAKQPKSLLPQTQ